MHNHFNLNMINNQVSINGFRVIYDISIMLEPKHEMEIHAQRNSLNLNGVMHLCLVSLLILFPMFRVLFLWYSILCVRLVVEVEVEILGWTFIAAAVKKKY